MTRGGVCGLWVGALLLVGVGGSAQTDIPAVERIEGGIADILQPSQTAETILAAQPSRVRELLHEDSVVVMQEVRKAGALSGNLISAFVIFTLPIEEVYALLAQSVRQIEFRPELTSIETVELLDEGPVDAHRLKILFQRYAYHLRYRLEPERHRIEWSLDERFENDLEQVDGFWELYALADGRTLGRSGTMVDVGKAVPAFLQDWITRKNLPKTMKRVRQWVDSGGTWRP